MQTECARFKTAGGEYVKSMTERWINWPHHIAHFHMASHDCFIKIPLFVILLSPSPTKIDRIRILLPNTGSYVK